MSACALPTPRAQVRTAANAAEQWLLSQASVPTLATPSNIRWLSWGNGTPVVLLHDWGCDWRAWHASIAHLARSCQVLVAELPAQHAAPAAQQQSAQDWAQSIQKDLHGLFAQTPFSLVAHGWGCLVAGWLVPALPQLSSLVLLGDGGHGRSPHSAAPQPDQIAALLHQQLKDLHKPMLMIWGTADDLAGSNQAAITLAMDREEREWMVLPNTHASLPQTRSKEINTMLTRWLLSHC